LTIWPHMLLEKVLRNKALCGNLGAIKPIK
jgi:hypothetical protein